MLSTRQRRTAWLVGLGLVAVAASGSLASERRYQASLEAVHETLAVQEAIADTLSLLKDAETGQRGFVLTGDDEFLAPHISARRALPAVIDRLKRVVAGDAPQEASAGEVERLGQAKLDELAETVALCRLGQTNEAIAIVRSGRGRQVMDAARDELDIMSAREAAQLAERERAADAGRRWLTLMLAGVWGFVLCGAGASLWSAARGVAEARRANERLQASEKALRTVADNASDLVRIIGERAELVYVSPSCHEILGYSPAEMLAMSPRALLHEEDRAGAFALTQRVQVQQGGNEPFIHRLRQKEGEYRWFETTYCLVADAGDAAGHILLTSRDIHDRKLAEDALRRQTARLESILTSMGDGVVVLGEDRRILIVNPTAQQYIHQEQGHEVPMDWAQLHQAYLPDGQTPFPSERGPLTRALQGELSDGVELILHDRAGVPRTFSVSARPIRDGATPAGGVAVYRDITEQRRAERQLQESEQRLRVLSEASFEGIAISKAGVVVDTNETFASWLGRTSAELVGTSGLSHFAPEDHERVKDKSGQSGVCYEAQMLRRDGTRFPVEVRGRHTTFRGESMRIAVVRDITEKRQHETELEAQADLLRAMSLRDELTGLFNRRGFLEHARQLLRNAARSRREACVFFADLNGMKVINDSLGHEVGDRAIIATAKLLTGVFRDSDILARLGGDEFAIFAPECSSEDVRAICERLAAHLESLNRSAEEPFCLSISIGSSAFDPGTPTDLDTLMERADQQMYEQKRARVSAGPSSRVQSRSEPVTSEGASESGR
jgi:diguanylate cyclase (GGDEF)-like protein/PAS domain S-box-containing protein